MTDQNNEGWPAVLRLNDHYMEEIVGWMQADDKVSGGMTYIRADRAAPEGQGYFGPMGIPHWSSALTPPPAAPTDNTALVEALRNLLKRDEMNTCQHDNTHRGGFLWEICDDCGAKWADDEGGKPEWQDPQEWIDARAALASREAPPAVQEPVAWRCKDYADDWIIYRNKSDADEYQAVTGCLMQPLYAAPPPACQQEAVTVADAGMAALKELANTQMNISLTDWQRISSTIDAALRALKGGA